MAGGVWVVLALVGLLAVAPSVWATPGACGAKAVTSARTLGDAVDVLACQGRTHGLIVVGDFHGTRQIPAFVGDLVAAASRRRPVRLGLEMPTSMQAALDAYLDSRGRAADRAALLEQLFWDHNDGRQSRAMLALIERMRTLRRQGRRIHVFLMVPALPERAFKTKHFDFNAFKESGMARAIRGQLAHVGKAQVIAYMGNWHSRYHTFTGESHASTLEQLANRHPVLVDPDGFGTAWVCEQDGCGVHAGGTRKAGGGNEARMRIQTDPRGRVLEVHVRMPPLTASMPAKSPTQRR